VKAEGNAVVIVQTGRSLTINLKVKNRVKGKKKNEKE